MRALSTAEAGVIPTAVPRAFLLGVCPDGFAAFHAGAGTELIKALQVAMVAIFLHIPLLLHEVPAEVAVKLLSCDVHLVPGRTSHSMCGEWDVFGKGG